MNYDEEELAELTAKIKAWPLGQYVQLMKFVRAHWKYADECYWTEEVGDRWHRYMISTVGWSDNEALVSALEDNSMFWMTCWESSRRGGHYDFVVSLPEAL